MSDLNTNVLQKTYYSAAQLEGAVKHYRPDSGYSDYQAFVDAENSTGISSLFMISHANVESAWGTSYLAKTANNLFGFNAYDANPASASKYASQRASILYYASFLKNIYLTPANGLSFDGVKVGRDYHGDTIHDIFEDYATAHDSEGNTIAGIMNALQSQISGSPVPIAPAAPPSAPTNGYKIQQGDTFWELEVKWHLPHGTLQALNPGVVATNLQIGQTILTEHGTGTAVGNTHTIVKGETFWGLEVANHWPIGVLEGLNPNVNPKDLQIGEVIRTP